MLWITIMILSGAYQIYIKIMNDDLHDYTLGADNYPDAGCSSLTNKQLYSYN